jgi:hypothetical protein
MSPLSLNPSTNGRKERGREGGRKGERERERKERKTKNVSIGTGDMAQW